MGYLPFNINNSISILTNNGAGAFSTSIGFSVGINPYSVAAGDFNGDGRDDLAVANYDGYVTVLLNKCLANSNNAAASVSAANFTPALAVEGITASLTSAPIWARLPISSTLCCSEPGSATVLRSRRSPSTTAKARRRRSTPGRREASSDWIRSISS